MEIPERNEVPKRIKSCVLVNLYNMQCFMLTLPSTSHQIYTILDGSVMKVYFFTSFLIIYPNMRSD